MACLGGISLAEIEAVALSIGDAFDRDAQILVAGNGGSAGIASHFACDLAKTTLGRDVGSASRRVRAIALTDNVPLITAWANDVRYEAVFAEQVRGISRPGDALVVISGSGSSPNILAALDAARDLGLRRVGLFGFDGGRARDDVDASVIVRSSDYGYVEIAHTMIAHLITDWLGARVRAPSRRAGGAASPR